MGAWKGLRRELKVEYYKSIYTERNQKYAELIQWILVGWLNHLATVSIILEIYPWWGSDSRPWVYYFHVITSWYTQTLSQRCSIVQKLYTYTHTYWILPYLCNTHTPHAILFLPHLNTTIIAAGVKYSQLLNLWWQKKLLIILKYKYIHPILLHNPSSMDSIIQTRYQKILPAPSNIDQSKKIDKNPRLRYFNPIIQDCFLIGGNRNS